MNKLLYFLHSEVYEKGQIHRCIQDSRCVLPMLKCLQYHDGSSGDRAVLLTDEPLGQIKAKATALADL